MSGKVSNISKKFGFMAYLTRPALYKGMVHVWEENRKEKIRMERKFNLVKPNFISNIHVHVVITNHLSPS